MRTKQILCVCLVAVASVSCARAQDVETILAMYDSMMDQVEVKASKELGILKNGRTGYALRVLEKGAGKASPLGMTEPVSANFYYGGFLHVRAGALATGSNLPQLTKATDHTGAPCLSAKWTLEKGIVLVRFSLLSDSEVLVVDASAQSTDGRTEPLTVRLQLYPQSFNRKKHGTPRANFLLTGTGEVVQASAVKTLKPAQRWMYLGDSLYKGKSGGAAVGIASDGLREAKVHLGGYSVLVDLSFKTAAGARFFLADYGLRPITDPGSQVAPALDGATERFLKWSNEKK